MVIRVVLTYRHQLYFVPVVGVLFQTQSPQQSHAYNVEI
jgi:hypothetical protein